MSETRLRFEPPAAESVLEILQQHRVQLSDQRFVIDFDRSQGSFLVNKITGKRYLDLFTFFASLPVGLNHPALDDPRFHEASRRVNKYRTSNPDIYSVEQADFLATLSRVALPPEYRGIFLIDGGALAVENALKAAFDWKVRKNLAAGRGEIGHQVVHFKQAFHGRSGYTLSLTNTHDPRKYQYYPRFDWPRLDNPKLHFPQTAENLQQTIAAEQKVVAELERLAQERGEHLAAIIIEPIQGEGGDNHFRPEFLQQLRRIADEYEMLLIFDEVQTGLGLTGSWWCFQQLGVQPDLLVFGKKTQVCGFASTDRIDEVENVFTIPSRISSTFGGSLADMVRSAWFIRIIEAENLVENARVVGDLLKRELSLLADRDIGLSAVRGRGLMLAFDLPSTEIRNRVRQTLFEANCLILPCGERSLRLRPQLGFSHDEAGMAIDLIERAVSAVL